MRRYAASALLLAALSFSFPATVLGVKRTLVNEVQSDYAGRFYQLRADLRGTDSFAAFNVVNEQGIQYRGREMAVLFYRMETVYVDRISSEGKREIRLTLYRNRNDARQIRGSVPAAPLPVGPDRDSAPGSFNRDLSTNVILEFRAGKEDPVAQREEFTALMQSLFYIKEAPTYDQRENFILSHPDLPVPRLSSITGLSEDLVREILKKREAGEP